MSEKILNVSRIKLSDYPMPHSLFVEKGTLLSDYAFHWHEHYELTYILSGDGTHVANGKQYGLSAGHLHFLLPTDFHELRVSEPVTLIKIIFSENDLSPSAFNALSENRIPVDLFPEEQQEELSALFSLALSQSRLFLDSPHYHRVVKNIVECILFNLLEYTKRLPSEDDPREETGIRLALVYLHSHFRKPISLPVLAEQAHMSPSHLSRLFHKELGVTYKEYLVNLRMRFAAKCLQNTDATVTEICYESGFGSLSNFITEFRRHFGLSPTAYRLAVKEQSKKDG